MITCVVFDFDGTLVDSVTIKQQVLHEVVDDIPGGSALIDTLAKEGIVSDRYNIYNHFVSRRGAHLPQQDQVAWGHALAERYGVCCAKRIAAAPDWPGALELLKWLSENGYSAYINSATPELNLLEVVEKRSFKPFLKGIFGGPRGKVENLKHIQTMEDIPKEACLMVGDMDVDQQAAEGFGCSFVRVLATPDALPNPKEHSVYDLKGIVRLLEEGVL